MINKSLSIVIPSYDKLESLRTSLFNLLPDLEQYSIAVYIVDDSPHFEIKEFVDDFQKIYQYVFYIKNQSRLGHDKNVVAALKQSKADYTWILGDRVGVFRGAIKKIIGIIDEKKYDIISVNKQDRKMDLPSKYYTDPNEVLSSFGWHLTYTGVTIYSSKALESLDSINFNKYKNFPQIALIFTRLSHYCSFFWVNEKLVYGLPVGSSYWINIAFSVFIDDWENAINNLPEVYNLSLRERVILEHSKKSDLFTTKFLYKMRKDGYFDISVVRQYEDRLVAHSNKSYVTLLFISVTPIWLIITTKLFVESMIQLLKLIKAEKAQKEQSSNLYKLGSSGGLPSLSLVDDVNNSGLDKDEFLLEMRRQVEINKKLSIVIPTFNREPFLELSLETHIPLAREYNIPIYVSDNASSDKTNEVVKKWMKEYDFLYYYRHEILLEPDHNFEFILNKPDTDYIWLMGDSSKINKKVLVAVLKQTNKYYDMILLNDKGRVTDVETQSISDKEYLLTSLGWNMTQMSTLIYSKKVIKNANYSKFYGTNFGQTGIALEYLAYQDNFSVKWNKELSVETLENEGMKKISWQEITFEIWIRKWASFVMSLPSIYSVESKLKMIQMHNKKTKIFSFRNLLTLRSKGFYSMRHYMTYKKYFDISIGESNKFKFILIALLPVKLVSFFITLYRKGS